MPGARMAVLVLFALAALPAASAATVLQASSISSPRVEHARLDGAAMHWETREHPLGALRLDLNASHVHAEVDAAPYLQAGVTGFGTIPPTTTASDHPRSAWTATNTYNETSVFVVPGPDTRLSVKEAPLEVSLPLQDCLQRPDYVPGARDPLCLPLGDALRVETRPSEIVLNGSFDVYLWGWEGAVTDAEGTHSFWTGARYSTPQPGVASVGPSERQYAKLSVEDGSLRIVPQTAITVFPESADLTVPQVALAGSRFVSAAGLDATVRREGAFLALAIAEGTLTDPSGVRTVVGPERASDALLPLWLVGLAAVPVAASVLVGADSRVRLRRSADSLAIGNLAAAWRHAAAAKRYPWTRRRASLLSIIALLRAQRFPEAEEELAASRASLSGAAADFLTAYLRAAQGRLAEARAALVRCVQAEPGFRHEAMAHPLLRPLLPDDRARGEELA